MVENDTGHLKSQAHELVKQHIEYDGNDRPEFIYTVRANAANGVPCSVVRYSYVGLTGRVEFMKEYTDVWDITWDLF